MIDIMENLQQYVPLAMEVDKLSIPGVGEREVHADKFHHLWFGRDQLTAKRARGSQHVRNNSLRGKDRLEGLKPVVKDWHAKVCLLGVSCTLHTLLLSLSLSLQWRIQDLRKGGAKSIAREARAQNFKPRPQIGDHARQLTRS